jgi:hypothetical protein
MGQLGTEADAAAHVLDQILAGRQAQAGTAFLKRVGAVGPEQFRENTLVKLRAMPGPRSRTLT